MEGQMFCYITLNSLIVKKIKKIPEGMRFIDSIVRRQRCRWIE